MILKEEIQRYHKLSIGKYGGSHGIRDEGLLESAIARRIKLLEETICTKLLMKRPQL